MAKDTTGVARCYGRNYVLPWLLGYAVGPRPRWTKGIENFSYITLPLLLGYGKAQGLGKGLVFSVHGLKDPSSYYFFLPWGDFLFN